MDKILEQVKDLLAALRAKDWASVLGMVGALLVSLVDVFKALTTHIAGGGKSFELLGASSESWAELERLETEINVECRKVGDTAPSSKLIGLDIGTILMLVKLAMELLAKLRNKATEAAAKV